MSYDGKVQFKRVERKQSDFPVESFGWRRTEEKWKPTYRPLTSTHSSKNPSQKGKYLWGSNSVEESILDTEIRH